jgi:NitT/TauT family transport system permease protein
MATGFMTKSEAVGLPPIPRAEKTREWQDRPILLRLLSVALFAGIWEIAGRIPVSFAFPTFSDTMIGSARIITASVFAVMPMP